MGTWLSVAARRTAARRRLALAVSSALVVPMAAWPGAPVSAAVAPSSAERQRVAQQERQALSDLAESSQSVRSAAVALSSVAARLPGARSDVARARGGLAGARATLAAANAALAEAERKQAAAEQRVAEADRLVQQGRDDVGQMARRTYQRGRLGGLRDVVEAGEPQDVLERASMLRSVFRHQDATLDRLTTARLALARTRAGLAAEQRAVARARERAREREDRARDIAAEAETAAARVASLVATRASALELAEGARAADQADYAQAQAASRALAERIREAARRAAAEQARRAAAAAEARRVAAAEAARRAAAEQAAAEQAAAERAARAGASRTAQRAVREAAGRAARRRSAAAAPPELTVSSAGMLWPCRGCPLTSTFGWRVHPIFGDRRLHAGIDMGAPIGTPVRAADSGTVLIAGSASGYGTLVVVGHGDGLSTAYAHMGTLSVSAGDSVRRGQKVGEVGNEGNSTGPHLHFELRRDGEPVDPLSRVSPP